MIDLNTKKMNKSGKSLLFISTHIITKSVISEYLKLSKVEGYDCVLVIDNTNLGLSFKSRICKMNFYGNEVDCFIFDEKLHKELNLPYIIFNELHASFSNIMWYNADYRFYYIKHFYPDYAYYWQFDYDVYCNDKSYAKFLDKYREAEEDLLITHFRPEKKNSSWCWTKNIDWIYDDNVSLYGSFFPVSRISNSAIDLLYNKRLEHMKIFQNKKNNIKNQKWLNCEIFVPTELMNNGFTCANIDEPNVTLEEIDLNDDRIFENLDGLLYHPVKGQFIERLKKSQKQYLKKVRIRFNFGFFKIKFKLNKFFDIEC